MVKQGAFEADIIGDVHGCIDELEDLLRLLDAPRAGRRIVFVGDLVNRGPEPVAVLRTVMSLCASGASVCVMGNHDDQLRWALHGRPVERTPELARTLDALDAVPPQFATEVRDFLDHLPAQLVLDRGALVVAHAGLPQDLHAQATDAAFERAVYGPTTGERDNFGFPIRVKPTPTDWAEAYRGAPLVVHGHKAIAAPQWIGRTLNIDTNCSRGGALTAFRYPEGQFLSVPARATYWSELHSA